MVTEQNVTLKLPGSRFAGVMWWKLVICEFNMKCRFVNYSPISIYASDDNKDKFYESLDNVTESAQKRLVIGL